MIPHGKCDKERNSDKEQLQPVPSSFGFQNTCIVSLAKNGGVAVALNERENLA